MTDLSEKKMEKGSLDIADYLKCNKCKKILVPPIFQCIQGHLICNACSSSENRCPECNDPYMPVLRMIGKLASTLEYPCSFQPKGCTKNLKWNEIDSHETDCEYGHYHCPEECCSWKGPNHKLHKHFLEKHKQLTLTSVNDAVFLNMDLTAFYHKIFIFTAFNCTFLLHLIRAAKASYTIVVLQFVGTERYSERFYYELEIQSPDGKQILKFETPLESNHNNVIHSENKVGLFDYLFENTENKCKLQLKEAIQRFEIKIIECPVCSLKMTSSVYVCSNGHSFCADCRSKLIMCPSCKDILRDARNSALEAIISEPDDVTLTINDIIKEEPVGSFSIYECPISYCSWKGQFDEIVLHTECEHSERYIVNNSSCTFFQFSQVVVNVGGKPFLIEDDWQNDCSFVIVRSYDNKHNYKYTIEFTNSDDNEENYGYDLLEFTCSGKCVGRGIPSDVVIDRGCPGVASRRLRERDLKGKITIEETHSMDELIRFIVNDVPAESTS